MPYAFRFDLRLLRRSLQSLFFEIFFDHFQREEGVQVFAFEDISDKTKSFLEVRDEQMFECSRAAALFQFSGKQYNRIFQFSHLPDDFQQQQSRASSDRRVSR